MVEMSEQQQAIMNLWETGSSDAKMAALVRRVAILEREVGGLSELVATLYGAIGNGSLGVPAVEGRSPPLSPRG